MTTMRDNNDAEPILGVENLQTRWFYPTPGPSPNHQGGEREVPGLDQGNAAPVYIEGK